MDGLEPRRCTATNRAGERCGRAPIPGGFVCVVHGGGAPAVQKSARDRLLAGADLAIDYLLKMLEPREPCPACGRSDLDRDPVVVRACQLVLDRSGFHPTLTVEQVAPKYNEFENYTEDELIEHTEEMLKRMIEARDFKRQCDRDLKRQCEQPRLDAGVIDAVVDEGYLVPEDDALLETPSDIPPIQELDVQNPSGNSTPEKRTTDDEADK